MKAILSYQLLQKPYTNPAAYSVLTSDKLMLRVHGTEVIFPSEVYPKHHNKSSKKEKKNRKKKWLGWPLTFGPPVMSGGWSR